MYFAHSSLSISLKIDGHIDLGPKWNLGKLISNRNEQQYSEPPSIRHENRQTKNEDKNLNKTANAGNTRFDMDNYYNDNFPSLFDTHEIKYGKRISGLAQVNSNEAKEREIDDIRQKLEDLRPSGPKKPKRNRGPHRSRHKARHKSASDKEGFSEHDNLRIEDGFTTKRKHKNHKSLTTGYGYHEVYRARKVKDDTKVYDFTVHVYKQTLKVFDDIQRKTKNVKLKRKVSSLKRSYEERFGDFLRQTHNHSLRTNTGAHKVILNTIDTSNKLLQRLINHLLHDMDREILRTNIGTVNVFQKEIDKEKVIENQHACKKLGVCKQSDDFSEFLVEIVTVILQSEDSKVKQAADALTEALKNSDLESIMDYEAHNKFKRIIENVETWDAFMSRAMFSVLKNIMKNKNKPIVIMDGQDKYLANKTVAFHDVLGILNERLPKAENAKKWTVMKESLEDWKEGRNTNISSIAENIINHLVEGLKTMDYDTRKRFNADMTVLVSHIK